MGIEKAEDGRLVFVELFDGDGRDVGDHLLHGTFR